MTEFLHGSEGPASPFSQNNEKFPRVARSSVVAEIQAATDAQEESKFARLVMAAVVVGLAGLTEVADAVSASPGVSVLDCKALWGSLEESESSALGMRDKRVAIEAIALKRSLVVSNTKLIWVHSLAQLADCMTKDIEVGRGAFLKYLTTGRLRLVYDPKFTTVRRRAEQGYGNSCSTLSRKS